jgi:hypothetical protein
LENKEEGDRNMRELLLILVLFLNIVNAGVTIKVPDSFTSNEILKFTIEASGTGEVEFPNIDKIDGFVVENGGTSSSISIINGSRTQKLSRTYYLYPNRDVTIPSFEIKIDSQSFYTKAKKVKKKELTKTLSSLYDLSISSDKKSLRVGEPVIVTIKFKYHKDSQVMDLKLSPVAFENFWYKQASKLKQYETSQYIVQEVAYVLFPQKSGVLKIDPMSVDISLVDFNRVSFSFFGTPTKKKKIVSNSLEFDVAALPDGIELYGDFKISSKIDKSEVEEGEAFSFQVEFRGYGNIDDLSDIKLNIPNTTIYENEPEKDYGFSDNRYGGVYKKSFSIVASESFVIPSITIKYLDKATNKIEFTATKEHRVKVIRNTKSSSTTPKLEKAQPSSEEVAKTTPKVAFIQTSDNQKILFFMIGLIVGVLASVATLWLLGVRELSTKNSDDNPLEKVKTSDELLCYLLPLVGKNSTIDRVIFKLEKGEHVDIKKVKKVLSRLKIIS